MSIKVAAEISRPGGFHLVIDTLLPGTGVTALYGPSGSGKTTLLRLLAGLDHVPGARVVFEGTPWQDDTGCIFIQPQARATGYVFQHLNLFPHLTVAGNLDYAARRRHREGGLAADEIIGILQLDELLAKAPAQLSGGEQQRVAIGRALMSNPRLLLLDEPLGAIDIDARTRILPYLQQLHRVLEIPVIYVSHSLDEVLYLADTVLTMDRGRVTSQGSVMDFAVSRDAARHRDAAAIVRCRVTSPADHYGLVTVALEQETLYINAADLQQDDVVRVRIPARDVSLTRQPFESSIVNVIRTRVDSIDDPGQGSAATVTLSCGGQKLLARITRLSLRDLAFKPGETVFAQIKGVALMTDHDR